MQLGVGVVLDEQIRSLEEGADWVHNLEHRRYLDDEGRRKGV